ncbi:MAG TPA: ABC transporter ATP-binding protein [Clostridiales bacterium]|nr:ABC transporter ATP-binding protein [Clostridiales bacterium]
MSNKLKKFISYYKPYKKLFFADMFFALLSAAISLAYPLVVRYITKDVLVNNGIDQAVVIILKLALLLIGLILIDFTSKFFVAYKGHMMGAMIEFDMRNEIFEHYQKLSFSFYDNQKVGQLMSRITNDLFDITELAHHGPEDLVISIIKFLGAFVILLNVNLRLTLIVFAFLPPMAIFAYILKKHMQKAFRRNRERIADINTQIEDNLSGIRVVKSFANEEIEIDKFHKSNNKFVDSKRNSYWFMAIFHSGLGLFASLINITIIVAGGLFIAKEIIGLSDLLTFLLYINNLIEPINKLINFTEQFQNGMTGFDRFTEMLEIEPDVGDKEDAVEMGKVVGNIEFNNVTFKYEGAKEDVFNNINLKVKSGTYIALVGPSGVGKTTMCSLIPRFYEISSGSILIDNVDIRDITLKSLRDNIGIVQQDVYLFTGSVMDNIRYGNVYASEEDVIKAAKSANAHEFIMELPDGYNTYIGQRGVKLSGGQKQRLSIARVFLKNPPILIFDEATSSLDNESEKIVQESLEKLAYNRTTFVIAHRLSTIKNAKTILVLTEEGISENGSHDELIELDGIYASLYRLAYNRNENESI